MKVFDWAKSRTVGGVTELAVLAPIRKGCPPDERWTYENRLRFVISRLQDSVDKSLPSHLSLIHSIHFGMLMIIRPEHYLLYSQTDEGGLPIPPETIPEYRECSSGKAGKKAPDYRSFLLTTVYFDGDLKVYIRDIAEFIQADFDNVYSNCEDYPSARDFEKFWQWVRRYQVSPDLFHNAYRDLSVVRIHEMERFKRRFEAFVTRVRDPSRKNPESMEELFDDFLRTYSQIAGDFPTPGGIYLDKIK